MNTLQIDVHSDDFGNEMVIPESSILIDKTQARYMGLLADSGIRALRECLSLSQAPQITFLFGMNYCVLALSKPVCA